MLVTEAFFLARRVHCYSQTTMAKNSCISSADAWLLTDIDEKFSVLDEIPVDTYHS